LRASRPRQPRRARATPKSTGNHPSVDRRYCGSCHCPDPTTRNRSRCDGTAHGRSGGASLKCYPDEVNNAEVNAHRDR
jgi:hypothetical protein